MVPSGGQNWNHFVFWVTICTHNPKELFQGVHNKAVLTAEYKNNFAIYTAHSPLQSAPMQQKTDLAMAK